VRVEHSFWAALVAAALVWYSAVTIYVAVRGVRDIREMTRRLTKPDESRDRDPGDGRR
jgi:hypothetical protein